MGTQGMVTGGAAGQVSALSLRSRGGQYSQILDIILTKYRQHSILVPSTSTAVTFYLAPYEEPPAPVAIVLHREVDIACQLKHH